MSSGMHLGDRSIADHPEWPQDRAAVDKMTNEQMWDFAGECDYEPAEEDVCLACYAMMEVQRREKAAKDGIKAEARRDLIDKYGAAAVYEIEAVLRMK